MNTATRPRWLWIGLALALSTILIALVGLWTLPSAPGGLPELATMPTFALTDQQGQPFATADVSGKVLLVGFIYTTCDDICPVVTAQMKGLQADLAKAGLLGEVQLLSISVDPEQDTPERLDAYARQFGADTASWRFLTGEPDHVRKVVVEGFLLGVQKVPAAGHGSHGSQGQSTPDYRVTHSGRIALVDGSGKIRAYYDGTSPDLTQIVAEARSLVGR